LTGKYFRLIPVLHNMGFESSPSAGYKEIYDAMGIDSDLNHEHGEAADLFDLIEKDGSIQSTLDDIDDKDEDSGEYLETSVRNAYVPGYRSDIM
jgi:hypothetical protein